MKKLSDNYVIYIVRGKMSRLYSGRRPLSNRSTWKRRSLSWPIFCGVLFKSGWEFLLTASYFKFFFKTFQFNGSLPVFGVSMGPDCLDLRDICFKGFHLFKASLGMLYGRILNSNGSEEEIYVICLYIQTVYCIILIRPVVCFLVLLTYILCMNVVWVSPCSPPLPSIVPGLWSMRIRLAARPGVRAGQEHFSPSLCKHILLNFVM